MITASAYLDRWGSDTYPEGKWCACDADRIRCVQIDTLKGALRLIAECCRVSPSEAQASLYSVCAQLQDYVHALEKLNNTDKEFVKVGRVWTTQDAPPSVAGRMEMTHADFQRACQVAIRDFQQEPSCQEYLVGLFCEAVRCSRECVSLARQCAELSVQLGKQKSQPIGSNTKDGTNAALLHACQSAVDFIYPLAWRSDSPEHANLVAKLQEAITKGYAEQAKADSTTNRFKCGCLVADAMLCTHGNSPLA